MVAFLRAVYVSAGGGSDRTDAVVVFRHMGDGEP